MRVGVPREVKNREYRVALTPAGVTELVRAGHTVIVEHAAGEVPPGVVARTSTTPAECAGAVTRTWVAERRVRPVAGTVPKSTALVR